VNASVVNATQWNLNDANTTSGYGAQNGIVYVVDKVISPLWYLNISLADLPENLNIPQFSSFFLA
jgi:hypothetical protein